MGRKKKRHFQNASANNATGSSKTNAKSSNTDKVKKTRNIKSDTSSDLGHAS